MKKQDRTQIIIDMLTDTENMYNKACKRYEEMITDGNYYVNSVWSIQCQFQAVNAMAITLYTLCKRGLDVDERLQTNAWLLFNDSHSKINDIAILIHKFEN